MSQVIPFESSSALAKYSQVLGLEKLGGISGGYPIISIKGKVFTKVTGDDREIIKKPGEDDPAASIDVVILKQNPELSKVFYQGTYSEGSDEKPTCYSNNGITPEADAEAPQSSKCATCVHNQWGSRITDNGGKGKACADSRRIAVAPIGMFNDPMLIRVPAASLKTLNQYGDSLVKRQVPYQLVATKIGFDYNVAHPALTFKALGMVDDASAQAIVEELQNSTVDRIIGLTPSESAVSAAAKAVSKAPVEEAPAKAEAHTKAAKVEAPVEEPAQPVVEKAKAKPTASVEVTGDLASEIESALSGLDFDDES